ncbi:uncharacterized protein LOC141850659 [Brevipalpus obovatus]|uniref:uncharacterized protein LOC141850659 n=1 Tax=Brevipalpus obovatus TaxID=246614 RepID=UPI003D9F32D3
MDLDKEEVLNELMNFEKQGGRNCDAGLPDSLERYLVCVAKTGDVMYPWSKIKPVIIKKFELVVDKFNTEFPYDNSPILPNVRPFNFQEMKSEIIERLESFYGAPFTIQRICELLTAPTKYYRWCDKFMRGLEKNIRVVSTIMARRSDPESVSNSYGKEYSRPSSVFRNSSNLLSSLPSSSSAYINGLDDVESSSSSSSSSASPSSSSHLNSSSLVEPCAPLPDHVSLPNVPAPLQQLDSFTTVFASPPSTPLAVVSDIQTYDSGSPSSSSSSSSDSSPQPSSSLSPPPCNDSNHSNDDSDDFEDARTGCEDLGEDSGEGASPCTFPSEQGLNDVPNEIVNPSYDQQEVPMVATDPASEVDKTLSFPEDSSNRDLPSDDFSTKTAELEAVSNDVIEQSINPLELLSTAPSTSIDENLLPQGGSCEDLNKEAFSDDPSVKKDTTPANDEDVKTSHDQQELPMIATSASEARDTLPQEVDDSQDEFDVESIDQISHPLVEEPLETDPKEVKDIDQTNDQGALDG